MKPRTKTNAPGEIRADAIYTPKEFAARLNIGDSTLRQWRKEGLPVIVRNSRPIILGSAAIEWLTREAAA